MGLRMMLGRRGLAGLSAAVIALGLVTPASAAAVRIYGRYHMDSTDCFFGADSCHTSFDIRQVGHRLTDPHDKYFKGTVKKSHVEFGERFPQGMSEDSWDATGTSDDGGRTVTGTMSDGTGGTGTFKLTYKSGVRVDGHYRIVSTDCYFSGGGCSAIFDIEESNHRLSSPTDKYFHGRVKNKKVTFGERYPHGMSEDSWSASGTTSDGGLFISGTMTDGIGGSGSFKMNYRKP